MENIMDKCSVLVPQLWYSYFLSSCPLLIFTLNFCPGHNFQTVKAINLKLNTLIEHIMEKCTVQEP